MVVNFLQYLKFVHSIIGEYMSFVTPLLTQLSWSNHLLIMSGCKSNMEREFYMRLCIKEGYSKRELERQINSGYYERYMLSKEKLLPEPIKGLKE